MTSTDAEADARLASAVVNEGQRWQAQITNLRNALREAGSEMDRRYEMGEAAERQRLRQVFDALLACRAARPCSHCAKVVADLFAPPEMSGTA